MTNKRIYADYNSTTPLKDEVKTAMWNDFEVYGNASSMHSSGRIAHTRVEEARTSVAALLGASPSSVIFTSGGSESNNAVFETMRRIAREGKNEFIITAIEHPCVLNSGLYSKELGFKVHFVPVDEYGKILIDAFKSVLSDKTLFVSVMMANNEIGTIQDIKEISLLSKEYGAYMHTDAVQAVGKIPVNAHDLGVDYLTMSSHKIYGPKGVGALYIREGAPFIPLIHGGHHEKGLRAGTYNNQGIFGFGKAAELALTDLEEYRRKTSALRLRLKDGLMTRIPDIKINGHPVDVLPNTLNVSFPGAEGEAILLSMDLEGIEASTGSACASGSLEPSHVLMATGVSPELAHGSIRFSLGWQTSGEDVDYIIETLPHIIEKLRTMSTLQNSSAKSPGVSHA
ncbi:MAG: cysteine desulfurase [Treponema sp.]|jgi:cysteine desulfurase|nr:cysteine desulfurase [Treponema sp.]